MFGKCIFVLRILHKVLLILLFHKSALGRMYDLHMQDLSPIARGLLVICNYWEIVSNLNSVQI